MKGLLLILVRHSGHMQPVSIGRGVGMGVLFKDAEALEVLGKSPRSSWTRPARSPRDGRASPRWSQSNQAARARSCRLPLLLNNIANIRLRVLCCGPPERRFRRTLRILKQHPVEVCVVWWAASLSSWASAHYLRRQESGTWTGSTRQRASFSRWDSASHRLEPRHNAKYPAEFCSSRFFTMRLESPSRRVFFIRFSAFCSVPSLRAQPWR
jgi:hypothetical protein